MKYAHLKLAVVLLAALAGGPAIAGELIVVVRGVSGSDGKLLVALFNNGDKFPRSGYWKGEELAPQSGTTEVRFKDLPPGIYAVSAIHDRNNNKKLDTNGIGIPIEPFAFSNNASAMDGPPTFSAASFKVGSEPVTQILNLK